MYLPSIFVTGGASAGSQVEFSKEKNKIALMMSSTAKCGRL